MKSGPHFCSFQALFQTFRTLAKSVLYSGYARFVIPNGLYRIVIWAFLQAGKAFSVRQESAYADAVCASC